MRKMIAFALVAAGLCLVSCSNTKTVTQQTERSAEEALGVELKSLKAVNLSEDGTLFSSNDDEILLCVNFFVKEGSVYVNRYNKFYGQWVFDKKNMERVIGDKFRFKKKVMRDGLLIFTLVELDQDNRENSLNEEIKTELLSELSANGGTINEAKIEALLKGNDLLGVKLVKMNEIAAATDTAVTFTGSKLMDKYNYILGWKLF